MTALNIRSARTGDIDAIMALETRGFHPAICESRAVMQQRLHHFNDGFLILENDRGDPIGYLCSELWMAADACGDTHFAIGHPIADTHRDDGNQLYISSMTIDPAYRGSGMGQRFFQQSVALLRTRLPQLTESVLMLSAEWRGAHRIYQSCGYQETGRLEQLFAAIAQHDADAIVMKLKFI